MSVKIISHVFERYPTGGGEMVLALAIADIAYDDGSHIYPSVALLAQKTRQSERTVQYQLRKMEESGWLILVSNEHGGRSKSREYQISPEWLKGADFAPNNKGCNPEKGCNPQQERVQSETERVQSEALKGAIAVAPEPCEPCEPLVNQKNKTTGAARFDFLRALIIAGVPENVARDYLVTRKTKKCAPTETAFNLLAKEVKDSGLSFHDAVLTCIRRGWGGFESSWLKNDGGRIGGSKAANSARFDLDNCDDKDYGAGGLF